MRGINKGNRRECREDETKELQVQARDVHSKMRTLSDTNPELLERSGSSTNGHHLPPLTSRLCHRSREISGLPLYFTRDSGVSGIYSHFPKFRGKSNFSKNSGKIPTFYHRFPDFRNSCHRKREISVLPFYFIKDSGIFGIYSHFPKFPGKSGFSKVSGQNSEILPNIPRFQELIPISSSSKKFLNRGIRNKFRFPTVPAKIRFFKSFGENSEILPKIPRFSELISISSSSSKIPI